uniref:Secreted protein n=1 Tax=Romanomermis culicivorax TaxID=13658 RepID=A0A915I066_ROMCU
MKISLRDAFFRILIRPFFFFLAKTPAAGAFVVPKSIDGVVPAVAAALVAAAVACGVTLDTGALPPTVVCAAPVNCCVAPGDENPPSVVACGVNGIGPGIFAPPPLPP